VAAWHKRLSCISLCYQADFAQILRFNIRWWLVVATVDTDLILLVVIIIVLTPQCNGLSWHPAGTGSKLTNWRLGCIIQFMHSICIMPTYYFTYGFPYYSFPAFSIPAFSSSVFLCHIFQSRIFHPLQKPAGLCRIFQSCIFMSRIFSVPPATSERAPP